MDTKTTKKQKVFYCIETSPILAILNSFLSDITFWLSAILIGFLIVNIINNRKTGDKIFNARSWKFLLWILTFSIYLISFLFIGHDNDLYMLSILLLAILVLINLIISKKFNIYKIKHIYWVFSFLFFVFALVLCLTQIPDIKNGLRGNSKKQLIEQGDYLRKNTNVIINNPLGCGEQTWF